MNDQILNEIKERFQIETENRDCAAAACAFVFAGKAFTVYGPSGRGSFAVMVQFPHAVFAADDPLPDLSYVVQPCSPIIGWIEDYRNHYQTTVEQLTFPLIAMNADSLAFAIRELNDAYNRLLAFSIAESEAGEILSSDDCEMFVNDLADAGELTPPNRLRAALFNWFEDTESETAKRLAFLRVDRSDEDADAPF